MLYIPFFGITGMYDGQPGAYSAMGQGAAEIGSAFGLFYITWFSVTLVLTLASIRSSIAVLVWIISFDITLILLAVWCWNPDMPKLLVAAGGAGIARPPLQLSMLDSQVYLQRSLPTSYSQWGYSAGRIEGPAQQETLDQPGSVTC